MTVAARRPRPSLRLPARRSLPGRLLLAQSVVLLAGFLTAGAVAAIVGPPLFHHHLLEAGAPPSEPEMHHVEEAYRIASLLSLGVAVAIAGLCAAIATWLFAMRLRRPFAALTRAAERVRHGDYAARVRPAEAGPELDALADAFNSMASRIEHTEDTRRRLLADLAHELRTPIATLGAWAEGLDDGVAVWDADSAAVVHLQIARLQRLAADLGEVSRAEEGRLSVDPVRIGVAELVGPCVRSHEARFDEAGVRLALDVPDATASEHLHVDRERIDQVLTNLLDNARRHTGRGGRVEVMVRRTADVLEMRVSDDGAGIAPDDLPHVFERFYRGGTGPGASIGSGIGLTISRAIVEAHGGSLTASSDGPGRGATFVVRLPLADDRNLDRILIER